MNVALTGGSGFIGQRLIARLLLDGRRVHAMGRHRPDEQVRFSEWEANGGAVPIEAIEGTDAIIHLAGEPIAQRWNAAVKNRIRDSRVFGTRAIVEAISKLHQRPQTFICASAIGYYGDRADEILDEQSSQGEGFLSEVCGEWEREARAAGNLGLRVVMLRFGIVLGSEGGALKQMLPPFRLGVGGPTASGRQWMSWIHADDLIEAMLFSLTNVNLFGPVNATSPNPVRNQEFAKALGQALGRPAVIHTPVFALKLILGEAAEIALASQRVAPKALERAGFEFRYPEIHDALKNAV
jgi:uncharacterized protein (TIGR01777 family)